MPVACRCAVAVILFAGPVLAQAPPSTLTLAARPAAITLYPDQASITRSGSISLPAGDSMLVLTDVPAGIMRDSVTARGRTSGSVAIGAVDVRTASFDPRAANARVAALQAELRGLEDAIAAIDVRIAGHTAQLSLIQGLAAGFAAQPRPVAGQGALAPLDPASWRSAWDAVRTGTEEASEAIRVARQERRAVEERRTILQGQIRSLGRPASGTLEITVSVRAEAATQLDLAIGYQLPGAGWRPVYEARLNTVEGRMVLRQEAIIAQQTGEDWQDVAMVLSTARPSADARAPLLTPWRIRLVDPAAQAAEREAGSAGVRRGMSPASQSAPSPPVAAAPGQDAQAVSATTASAGFAVEYRIPGRASLASDGSERRVRIGDLEIPAELTAHTTPRLDPRGFLGARFANPSETPTLPGPVALYLDGVLVGRATLPLLRPTEAIMLPFGADDRIQVSYRPQPGRRADEGSLLTGRTQSRTTEAIVTIRSFHQRPMNITMLDRLPVSGDEGLTVALIAEPAPTTRDVEGQPGIMGWTAIYTPGEERRIRFGYTISAPRDRVIQGLER